MSLAHIVQEVLVCSAFIALGIVFLILLVTDISLSHTTADDQELQANPNDYIVSIKYDKSERGLLDYRTPIKMAGSETDAEEISTDAGSSLSESTPPESPSPEVLERPKQRPKSRHSISVFRPKGGPPKVQISADSNCSICLAELPGQIAAVSSCGNISFCPDCLVKYTMKFRNRVRKVR